MNIEKWKAYQEKVRQSMEQMRQTPFSLEQAIEQQRRLDKAAGQTNPFLGMSFKEEREIRMRLKNLNQ